MTILTEQRKFTREELTKFDGRNGNPAYVAYNNKVYDVTNSSFWIRGDHLGAHQAGTDLTEEMDLAPHGAENIERAKLVGTLV